jgi:hypothetical protein
LYIKCGFENSFIFDWTILNYNSGKIQKDFSKGVELFGPSEKDSNHLKDKSFDSSSAGAGNFSD